MKALRHLTNPYHTQRNPVFARKGMVATSQPLAAEAGLHILKKGGNAVDAAIATAACLTVVEPTSNGIGGDLFAIVWMKNRLYGLNGSGKSPKNISIEKVKAAGHERMPVYGWEPVTVPGAPAAWVSLSERFGNLSLAEVLEPAITYAEEGYPLSPTLARFWKRAYDIFRKNLSGEKFNSWFKTFAPKGTAPKVGDMWSSKDHARTLKLIAETKGKAFYQGEIAKKIVSFSKETGGYFEITDFLNHKSQWVEPISINYRGYDVWELPPNGQGLVALQALNILKGFDFTAREDSETFHQQIEAMKLAFADGLKYITDERHMDVKIQDLLSEEYAEARRKLIRGRAENREAGEPKGSGTVYLATADKDGNMVSLIQSNYMGFGSGLVVPGTGIALQNRGYDFSLNPEDANALEGGKRTYHTIIPGFLTKDHEAIGPFGVMGGYMMPQGHVQIIMNTIDFQLNPQAALDAPRWQWFRDNTVQVEDRFPQATAMELIERGHDIKLEVEPNMFGRGQIIWRNPETGVLLGGTESRTDGHIAAW